MKQLFDRARGLAPGERDAFVRSECAAAPGGAELAEEVLALLNELDMAGAFLDAPTGAAARLAGSIVAEQGGTGETRGVGEAARDEGVGSRIGPYRLLELIGEGGFGMVYMAEQSRPIRRLVALKVIKLGMDTRQVTARFEQERQALAMMDHPNIAKVLDAGTTPAGRPYFVMELVRGLPITRFCDERRMGVADRLAIFTQVCGAVQHAHQKGVIHRDIKPTNVLVTVADGNRPIPKVIDFGIAKATRARLTEKTLFTEFRQMVGTPEYMSPEQAGLGGEGGADIDTRSDVYSLGVLLYELLTGVTPFDSRTLRSAAYDELRRIIREVDPPRPSTRLSGVETLAEIAACRRTEPVRLRSALRGELDWIVMRCLEKERVRRYPTASDIAKDVGRHLAHEPLDAGPPGAAYRVRKFVRRNRRGVIAASMVLATLALGLLGTSAGAVWALRARARAADSEQRAVAAAAAESEARRRADDHAVESRTLAYRLGMGLAAAGIAQGNLGQTREALADAPSERRGWEWSHLAWACDPTAMTFDTPPDTVAVAVSGNGKLVFTRGVSGEVRLFDAATGRLERTVGVPPGKPWTRDAVTPNHDGSLVVVSHAEDGGTISLWDTRTGARLWSEGAATLCGVSFVNGRWRRTPSGAERVGLMDDRVLDVLVFGAESIRAIDGPIGDTRTVDVLTERHGHVLWSLAEQRELTRFSPERWVSIGKEPEVVVAVSNESFYAIEPRTGEREALDVPRGELSPAGHGAFGGGFGVETTRGIVRIYRWPSTRPLFTLTLPRMRRDYRVSADGLTAYIVEGNGTTRAVHLGSEQPLVVPALWRGGYASAIAPTGARSVTVGWGSVCTYDTQTGENIWSAYPSRHALYAVAFTGDGKRLAVGGKAPVVTLLDASNGESLAHLPVPEGGLVTSLAWSPGGDRLLAGMWDGQLLEYTPADAAAPPTVWPDAHTGPVAFLEYGPDGSSVLSVSQADLRLKDHHADEGGAGRDNTLRLRRAGGEHEAVTPLEAQRVIEHATFSPDGSTIAVAADGELMLLAADDGRVAARAPLPGHGSALAFHPMGGRLAVLGTDDRARVFALPGLDQVASLRCVTWAGRTARFTPDGRTLLAADTFTPVIAFETGPPSDPARRFHVACVAQPVVDAFVKGRFVAERAMDTLRADPFLSPEARSVALDMARARGDDPNQIQNVVLLHMPNLQPGPEWAPYVEGMEAAVRVLPNDPGLQAVLGVCQLRAGRAQESLETMRGVLERAPESSHELLGRTWAAIAIARCETGEVEQAAAALRNAVRHREALGEGVAHDFALLVVEAQERVNAAAGGDDEGG